MAVMDCPWPKLSMYDGGGGGALSSEAVSYRLSFEGCLLETVQICTASQVQRIECRLL